jgi:hypothetical protein
MRYPIFILFILFSITSAAQVNFAITGGLGLSRISSKGGDSWADNYSPRLAGHLGGIVDVDVAKHMLIRTGLIYSARGSSVTNEVGIIIPTQEHARLKLKFLEVPLLLTRYNHGFEIFAGPQFSYLLSAKFKFEDESEDIKEGMNATTLDGRMGLGVSPGRFAIQLSYLRALTPIMEQGSVSWKNHTLYVSAGFRLTDNKSKFRNSKVPHRALE